MRLKDYREKAEIKQGEFAEKYGVTQRTVSEWEHGKVTPTLENAVLVADFFGVKTFAEFREMWDV